MNGAGLEKNRPTPMLKKWGSHQDGPLDDQPNDPMPATFAVKPPLKFLIQIFQRLIKKLELWRVIV